MEGSEDAAAYEAVALSSATYAQRWLTGAVEFAQQNKTALTARPLWTFTAGRHRQVHPRGHSFSGAIDGSRLSRGERLIFKATSGRCSDFRNWPEIDARPDGIAHELSAAVSTSTSA